MHIDITPCDDWFEFVFNDAKSIASLMGIEISNIYFSGFSSQGDGACFEAQLGYRRGCAAAVRAYAPKDTELHVIADAWAAAHKRHFYQISGRVRHSGRYSHEFCTNFEFERGNRAWGNLDASDDESAFIEPARDLMRWIYRQLEREYEYASAWECARQWEEARVEMADERKAARELVRDMRAAIKAGQMAAASICSAIRAQLRAHLEQWEEARERRDYLAGEFYYRPDDRHGLPAITIEQFAESNL